MLFIVLPAFNEENKIGRVIRGLFEHGYNNIVVVNDGSSDNTATEAESAGAVVLNHAINRGQGAALQTGNEYALQNGAEILIHFDADGQFNPSDIAGALNHLKENNLDIVLGSRFLDHRSNLPFFKKYFILPISRAINNFVSGLKLTDVHNGFRIMHRVAAEQILITQDRMAHNSEIPRLIKEKKLKYTEYPVEVFYHENGQGVSGGVKILLDLIIAKFNK